MDSVKYLVENTNSIDFVFSGHEHGTKVLSANNTDGKSIPIVQPNTKAKAIGQIIVTYDKATKTATLHADDVSMTQRVSGKTVPCYDIDPELGQILKPYEEATWKDYMLQVIGQSNGDYSAAGLGTAPSAFMDLVNRVQILGAYDRTGKNTPNNPRRRYPRPALHFRAPDLGQQGKPHPQGGYLPGRYVQPLSL